MIIKSKDEMLESYATQNQTEKQNGYLDDSGEFNSSKEKGDYNYNEKDLSMSPRNFDKDMKVVRLNSRTIDSLDAKFVLDSSCQDTNSQVSKLLRENETLNAQLTELKISITNNSSSGSPFTSHSSSSRGARSIYLNKEEVLADPLVEMYMHEIQDDAKKEVAKYKLEASTLEQDIAQLKANIVRLEGQVNRYKESADFYEKAEDELKGERRRLQRENRQQVAQIEELTTTRDHLERRLERMRQHQQKDR